jgi:uncharacterized surface protein with fasciclin (FAS1) repeats
MKMVRIALVLTLLGGLAAAQTQGPANGPTEGLLTAAAADHTLSMFVAALQSSGLASRLRDGGPLTVFALPNQAFANLGKEDLETLLANRVAMHALLAHYVAHGSISNDDRTNLSSARTLLGARLRTYFRGEDAYVNGAKLGPSDTRCTNGVIHLLNSFDPGLVHDAVAVAKAGRRAK